MSSNPTQPDLFDWEYDGPVIEMNGLKKHFKRSSGLVGDLFGSEEKPVRAVDGVDLHVNRGEQYGLVGESGCGKSTLGENLIGLQERTSGTIKFFGTELDEMNEEQRREFRQNVQMIFQDPYESVNPRFTVGDWVREPLEINGIKNKGERTYEALERAGLTPPERFVNTYTQDLSGGQQQRVSIARAIVLKPMFLLADEPVSMLDVSVRASVLDVLDMLVEDLNMAVIYISHDISLIQQMCSRIGVMYLGKLVEEGMTEQIIQSPKHPYTRALIESVPVPDPSSEIQPPSLEGEPPDPINLPEGCNFRPRCPYSGEQCFDAPDLNAYMGLNGHHARCFRSKEIEAGEVNIEPSDQV